VRKKSKVRRKRVVGVVGVEGVEVVGVAEGAADEHGGAVADVAGDEGVGQGRLADVGEGGVDGVAEVEGGVDERAVEIEDEQTGRNTNHGASVSAPFTVEGDGLEVSGLVASF
jgi:hypothetical protein